MGLMRSLYAGVSGLRNHQIMMDVLGNNISNTNTIGFKSGRVSFSEAFAQTLRGGKRPYLNFGGTNPMQVGLGISLSTIDTMIGQGNIETTGQVTDLAIQGDSFFIVSDGTTRRYTRAGNFSFDAVGTLVMPGSGVRVQGYLADDEGVIQAGSPLTDIKLPFGKRIGTKPTSLIELAGNLNASTLPVGNILKTDEIFAVEEGTSDILGLLASGSANSKLSGIVPNVTEITVLYGATTKSYKYVSMDSAIGNGAFHSLNDLIAEINNDFNVLGLTVSLDGSGALTFSGGDNLDITSNNPQLQEAMKSANGNLTAGDTTSDTFSHVATGADLLTNLRNEDGQSLELAVGDEITISGFKGGEAISPNIYSVTATSTYEQFAIQVKNAFEITNSNGVEIDPEDGSLVITADGGTLYELSAVDIRADDTPGAGGTDRAFFNEIYDSTPGHYSELQTARDARQSASTIVYDSQGNTYDLTIIFTKDVTSPNRWQWEVEVGNAVVSGGHQGYAEFNGDGSLREFEFLDGSTSLQFIPGDGSSEIMTVDLDVGILGSFDGLTQLAGPENSVQIISQDGHGMGTLDRIIIDEAGRISGVFSNGVVQVFAGIAMANFYNPSGLERLQGNLFSASGNSGDPIISSPGEAPNSKIISGALEQSNVDLAEQFTNMIVAQRGFQANARIITTSDDLLQEVTNLKR
jgi:flagellar hook protein FlgE